MALGQKEMSREEYISRFKDIAIREMNAYGIPASITLAQGILESGSGNSELARKANNHFGIKCHKGWDGPSFRMDDDAKDECFRKYRDPEESFVDHSIFLATRDRYAFLFNLDITDYKGWAHGLKKAGYATNPHYARLLIKIIEENNLDRFDRLYGQSPDNPGKIEFSVNQQKEDFEPVKIGAGNREIFINNGVKFIYARKGDTDYKIASEFNIYSWQVRKYNYLNKNDIIHEGMVIYLEKLNKSHTQRIHIVQPGEDLVSIARKYAVQLKKLARYNQLEKDAILYPGQRIKLAR
ncbi:MAG: glucosaminidase domain-containing protein [Bacteroidales bacterium]